MLGDTITATLGGSGGTAVTLNKINQDNYSAEYLGKEASGLFEVRLRVRHTRETVKAGSPAMDRHNVELTQTIYATLTEPEIVRQFYYVFRATPADAAADVIDVAEAVTFLSDATFLGKILGWQS